MKMVIDDFELESRLRAALAEKVPALADLATTQHDDGFVPLVERGVRTAEPRRVVPRGGRPRFGLAAAAAALVAAAAVTVVVLRPDARSDLGPADTSGSTTVRADELDLPAMFGPVWAGAGADRFALIQSNDRVARVLAIDSATGASSMVVATVDGWSPADVAPPALDATDLLGRTVAQPPEVQGALRDTLDLIARVSDTSGGDDSSERVMLLDGFRVRIVAGVQPATRMAFRDLPAGGRFGLPAPGLAVWIEPGPDADLSPRPLIEQVIEAWAEGTLGPTAELGTASATVPVSPSTQYYASQGESVEELAATFAVTADELVDTNGWEDLVASSDPGRTVIAAGDLVRAPAGSRLVPTAMRLVGPAPGMAPGQQAVALTNDGIGLCLVLVETAINGCDSVPETGLMPAYVLAAPDDDGRVVVYGVAAEGLSIGLETESGVLAVPPLTSEGGMATFVLAVATGELPSALVIRDGDGVEVARLGLPDGPWVGPSAQ